MTHPDRLDFAYTGGRPDLTRTLVAETFAECGDCGGHRIWIAAENLFRCDAACDEGLAPIDVLPEWNETWTVLPDATDRLALVILEFDTTEDEENDA